MRVKRRPPPKISVMVYFVQGGRSKKVGSFKTTPGALLGPALKEAGATFAHEHPEYPDEFITGVSYRRSSIVASHNGLTGDYVYGVGSEQITFKLDGTEFENASVDWQPLPGRSCKLVIELEPVTRVANSSLPVLAQALPGEVVFGGA